MNTTTDLLRSTNQAAPGNGTIREEFGAMEVQQQYETAVSSAAAMATAAIQARYIVAMKRGRSEVDVQAKLLRRCEDPDFAKASLYFKPVGDGVTGLSIRFVETALAIMGNVLCQSPVTYEDDEKRIVDVLVSDLETNTTYTKSVTVTKTVERKFLKKDQVPLRIRENSKGERVYILQATDDELINKENNLVSKTTRTLGLRIVDSGLKIAAERKIRATLEDEDARNPDEARNTLVSSFMGIGVTANNLAEYLGHSVDQIQPAELIELRALYAAIRDAEATWKDAMAMKHPTEDSNDKTENKAASDLREKVANKLKKPEPKQDTKATGNSEPTKQPQQSGTLLD